MRFISPLARCGEINLEWAGHLRILVSGLTRLKVLISVIAVVIVLDLVIFSFCLPREYVNLS